MKLKISEQMCSGCQICQVICCTQKYGTLGIRKARIHILSDEEVGAHKIRVCRQCKDCKCIEACHYDAFKKNAVTGGVYIDDAQCQGCLVCIDSCPFGAVTEDAMSSLPLVCDLCAGQPACAKLCARGAIRIKEA